jgi:hypothetical protein
MHRSKEISMTTTTTIANDHWGAGRIAATLGGGFAAFVGLLFVLGGLVLVIGHSEGRDSDGYYSTHGTRLSTTTHALTAEDLDFGSGTADAVPKAILGRVRVGAERPGGEPVFIGIGPERDVNRYLEGVAHAEIDDPTADPPEYRVHDGGSSPQPPAAQRFWTASATGSGRQALDWKVDGGEWALVIMDRDGGRGVTVDADVAAKVGWLLPAGIGLLAFGLLLGVGGAITLVLTTRRRV